MYSRHSSSCLLPGLEAEAPPVLPPGFHYEDDFLTRAEEAAILSGIAGLSLRNSQYHEYTARRRTAGFGLRWNYGEAELKPAPPAPDFLQDLAAKVAARFGFGPELFPHALVTEYPPGAPMGWHRDAPPFAEIYGVSLAAPCRFRLRPQWAARPGVSSAERRAATIDLTAEPRSLYVMSGPARSDWQHAVAPVKELRYSITLRTLERQQRKAARAERQRDVY